MKDRKRAFFRAALPVLTVAFLLFIFSNSMQSGDRSGGISRSVSAFLASLWERVSGRTIDLDLLHRVIRKLAHFSEFGVYSFLLSASCLQRRKSGSGLFFQALAAALFAAVTDEYLQTHIAGRGPSVTDVTIDLAGALTGLGLALLIGRSRLKKIGASRIRS